VATIQAEFDGRVFVPCEPVRLPPGTRVEIVIPWPPGKLSPDQLREWEEIQRQIATSEPHFRTVEEAMSYTRKRP
jgi:predicted DNA-binding antitoxin AbrB/MazE fold protein